MRANAILLVLLCISQTIQSYRKCPPGVQFYKIDCNTCWCVGKGIPVCTKVKCNMIPKKFQAVILGLSKQRGKLVNGKKKELLCVRIIKNYKATISTKKRQRR